MILWKDRKRRAVEQLAKRLKEDGHRVSFLKKEIFDIEDWFGGQMRKIKVCLDSVEIKDCNEIINNEVPAGCLKEIYLKEKDKKGFIHFTEQEIKTLSRKKIDTLSVGSDT